VYLKRVSKLKASSKLYLSCENIGFKYLPFDDEPKEKQEIDLALIGLEHTLWELCSHYSKFVFKPTSKMIFEELRFPLYFKKN